MCYPTLTDVDEIVLKLAKSAKRLMEILKNLKIIWKFQNF
jgi:hypothetical protein